MGKNLYLLNFAKIFADVRLLMCLILVIFCDTKGFQLFNFATFFKLVLHGNKYIYQITNLLTVNKLNNYLSNIISRFSDWISMNFFFVLWPSSPSLKHKKIIEIGLVDREIIAEYDVYRP